jgi:hypothetical protein
MKSRSAQFLKALLTLCLMGVLFSSCYEGRYYHHYHHHTRGWYDYRHVPPPAGVDFRADVDLR